MLYLNTLILFWCNNALAFFINIFKLKVLPVNKAEIQIKNVKGIYRSSWTTYQLNHYMDQHEMQLLNSQLHVSNTLQFEVISSSFVYHHSQNQTTVCSVHVSVSNRETINLRIVKVLGQKNSHKLLLSTINISSGKRSNEVFEESKACINGQQIIYDIKITDSQVSVNCSTQEDSPKVLLWNWKHNLGFTSINVTAFAINYNREANPTIHWRLPPPLNCPYVTNSESVTFNTMKLDVVSAYKPVSSSTQS